MELTALLIAQKRDMAEQFTRAASQVQAFQILADMKSYPGLQALEMKLRQWRPQVVLLDVASDLDRAAEIIQFITGLGQEVLIVGLHTDNHSETLLKVLRAGATEFLHAPFEPNSQREAVARLSRLCQPAQEINSSDENGSVVVFTSAKPGSGASTLATQTAFALRRSTGKKVLLADFDLMGGTIGFYLKVDHAYSLIEALQHADHLDPALWNSIVVNAGGVDILAAPLSPYTDPVENARLHVVLNYSKMIYDWIVVDLPLVFQRTSLITLSESDHAFLVSTSELPSLHLARKAVNMLEQLGLPKERFRMVVNRVGKRDGIATADMEKLFNCPVYSSVPNDYFSLHRVITLGQPLSGDGELGKAIDGLATKLAGQHEAAKKKASATLSAQKPALSVL
ncbi:MAG TPA: P-loop NTPase [Bryobacteraceae bacterium]|jgi:pilus assembly protein CpaE